MSAPQSEDAAPAIEIGARPVGPGHPTYVIAEVGSNHDGDLDTAREYVRAAAKAGADAVKFQSFRASTLAAENSAGYGILRSLELPEAWHPALQEEAVTAGVDFLSTPFDASRVELLASLDCPAIKIASGDLTHTPLLRSAAETGLPILLSTGLAYLDEVREAVELLRRCGDPPLLLLHCVAAYPPPFDALNLRALGTLAEHFGCPVGFSDHSPGSACAVAAVALGATAIEKHVTFDRERPGPDHAYALPVEGFADLVAQIRSVEAALGDGVKRPAECESEGRIAGRRGVCAAVSLAEGTLLEAGMLKIVRPALGLAPSEIDQLLGRRTRRAIAADEPIAWRDLCD